MNRRHFLKNSLLVAGAAVLFATAAKAVMNDSKEYQMPENPKIITVYFSYSGNTREIAEQIHAKVGGDIFEIKTTQPYPADYRQTVNQAKQEKQSNTRPALEGQMPDLSAYNVVFIGYPNWWYTMPMPLFTFLDSVNLSGKTVIPFCTHGGGGLSNSVSDLEKLAPDAKIATPFAVNGNNVRSDSTKEDLSDWLLKLGVKN